MPATLARVKAVQLAREYADARAEEISQAIEKCNAVRMSKAELLLRQQGIGLEPQELRAQAASIARSFIQKPKTREQVLEEALRYYADRALNAGNPWADETSPGAIARRALGGSQLRTPGAFRAQVTRRSSR
jgi:hypothetical protein